MRTYRNFSPPNFVPPSDPPWNRDGPWRLLVHVSSSLAWLERCLVGKLLDDLRERMGLQRRNLRAQHAVRLWMLTGAWLL